MHDDSAKRQKQLESEERRRKAEEAAELRRWKDEAIRRKNKELELDD